MPSISYPCLTCPRDEDYCHETCQDQHCPAWQIYKRQVIHWLIATKKEVKAHAAEMSRL